MAPRILCSVLVCGFCGEAKIAKKTYSKRRKLIIGCTSPPERSLAAEVIAGNEDLLTEILIRVPAKSLIRFKCVSKQWLSLIPDSQFATNHAGRNSQSSISGLYLYFNPWFRNEQLEWCYNEQLDYVSLDGHPNLLPTLPFLDGVTTIEHSCNGLMLCSNGYQKPQKYAVCNPTTKKYTLLPQPDRTLSGTDRKHDGALLAFDPSKSPHYKVLLFDYLHAIEGNCYQIKIYRSESSSWKQIRLATALPGVPFALRVFCNNAIHWLSTENLLHIRFEVEEEKLIQTPMPPNPKILSEHNIRYFGECDGHLILIQVHRLSAMGFRILEMDKDYGRWIVKCRVNLRPVLSLFSKTVHTTLTRSRKFLVLCVVKGAHEKDFTLVLAIPGKIVSFNLKSKTSKVLCDLSSGDLDSWGSNLLNRVQFIESLSPV